MVLSRQGNSLVPRPLNDYEAICCAAYQISVDFFRSQSPIYTKNNVRQFFREKFQISFDEAYDYFSSVLRNHTVLKRDAQEFQVGDISDDILKIASDCGIDDSEVVVKPYEDGTPYSYNVRTIDKENALKLYNAAKSKGYIIDRFLGRLVEKGNQDFMVYSFRIRRPAQ